VALWGIDPENDRLTIRGMRAAPPSLAAKNAERRNVFAAALGQFDELLSASSVVGPASSPLLLYYAAGQAGRAIGAAHQPDPERWQPRSHGLKLGAPPSLISETLLAPDKPPKSNPPRDMFRLVADTTGSARITGPVTLGGLWAAAPQTPRNSKLDRHYPIALALEAVGVPGLLARISALPLDGIAPHNRQRVTRRRLTRSYPATRADFHVNIGEEPDEHFAHVHWDGVPFEEKTARLFDGGATYLMPAVGDQEDQLSPLMAWWALLFALSNLARYYPAAWMKALDPVRSPIAAPIESALSYAKTTLPAMAIRELVK
jgi:hypothetical protein